VHSNEEIYSNVRVAFSLSTVIYLNLRVCKEDLTRETLATELGVDVQSEVPMMATGMPVMKEDIPVAEKEENDII
jgi:hypothetical protein